MRNVIGQKRDDTGITFPINTLNINKKSTVVKHRLVVFSEMIIF